MIATPVPQALRSTNTRVHVQAASIRNASPLAEDEDAALARLGCGLRGLAALDLSHFHHPRGLPHGLLDAISHMTALTSLRLAYASVPQPRPRPVGHGAAALQPQAAAAPPQLDAAAVITALHGGQAGPLLGAAAAGESAGCLPDACGGAAGARWSPSLSFLAPLAGRLAVLELAGWEAVHPDELRHLRHHAAMTRLDISRQALCACLPGCGSCRCKGICLSATGSWCLVLGAALPFLPFYYGLFPSMY